MNNSAAQIGLGVQGDLPMDRYAHIGKAAEAAGFDTLAVFADVWFLPPIVPLTVIATHTEHIRLGPSCLNPYTLGPSEIIGQVAALDAVSGGRAFLGLTRGAWLDGVGISQARPLALLRDVLELFPRMLADDRSGYQGSVLTIAPGQHLQYPVPRNRIPIMVGTWSPRLSALAGELADEVKIGASASPAMAAKVRDWIVPGAEKAGRDPGEVGVVVGAVTVVDDDGEQARRRARTQVARYLNVVGAMDSTAVVSAELVAEVDAELAAGRVEAAGDLVPDEVLDAFAFAGTPEQVADHALACYAAGATRVEFNSPYTMDGTLDLLADKVLPLIRAGLAVG